MAVNESDAATEAAISGLGRVTSLKRFAEDGSAPAVTDGVLRDTFEPWGVHVYREP